MSRKKIEAYNELMKGIDERAAAHLVKQSQYDMKLVHD